jgi:hypothetical protein
MRGQAHARRGSDRGDEGRVEGRTEGEGGAGQAAVLTTAAIAPPAMRQSPFLALCWQVTPKKSKLRAFPPPSLPPFLSHSLSWESALGRWSVRDSAQQLITVSSLWPPRRSVPK